MKHSPATTEPSDDTAQAPLPSYVRRPSPTPSAPRREEFFVGRRSHLQVLWEAFESTNLGRAMTMLVHGPSGVGKSSLVGHFLRELRQREPDVVVLAGRCYEQELVPYKAIDSLVDNLTRYLCRLSPPQVEKILPRDVHLLARLFPVLEQVEAVSTARRRTAKVSDLQELRRRAFTALRELLARLADQTPLVLFIDDLQWGDLDSGALLAELLRLPGSSEPLSSGERSEAAPSTWRH